MMMVDGYVTPIFHEVKFHIFCILQSKWKKKSETSNEECTDEGKMTDSGVALSCFHADTHSCEAHIRKHARNLDRCR